MRSLLLLSSFSPPSSNWSNVVFSLLKNIECLLLSFPTLFHCFPLFPCSDKRYVILISSFVYTSILLSIFTVSLYSLAARYGILISSSVYTLVLFRLLLRTTVSPVMHMFIQTSIKLVFFSNPYMLSP